MDEEERRERGHSRGLVYLIVYLLALGIGFHLGTCSCTGGYSCCFFSSGRRRSATRSSSFTRSDSPCSGGHDAVPIVGGDDRGARRSSRRSSRGARRERGASRSRRRGSSLSGSPCISICISARISTRRSTWSIPRRGRRCIIIFAANSIRRATSSCGRRRSCGSSSISGAISGEQFRMFGDVRLGHLQRRGGADGDTGRPRALRRRGELHARAEALGTQLHEPVHQLARPHHLS